MSGFFDEKSTDFYHQVVDCQWACPAHTDVPEYIRLIAAGRYTDAYLVNRQSNVFPGVLGRVCDRPCEPACRRGRVENEPVAICRLKRFAADHKDDVEKTLKEQRSSVMNGRKIALIGGGPASLTVANDLLPLGYECTIFEKDGNLGGAMRSLIPLFRLPSAVLNEEIRFIVNMGLTLELGQTVTGLKDLLLRYDRLFVASGAPLGKELNLPGRKSLGSAVAVGIEWLQGVSFGQIKKIAGHVLVIGGGNTAMDCARTALRLGADRVTVVAPEGFDEMLASPWEKDDASQEGIGFRNGLLPYSFEKEENRAVINFSVLASCYDGDGRWAPVLKENERERLAADQVLLAIGQERSFPFIESDLGIDFGENGFPVIDPVDMRSSHPKIYFGGDAAFGPKNIIWAVAHGHRAAKAIHESFMIPGEQEEARTAMTLTSQRMGLHDWSYSNHYSPSPRQKMSHFSGPDHLNDLGREVELGFTESQVLVEVERCLNCDIQTVFAPSQCIECDACVDICPVDCLSITDASLVENDLSSPRLDVDQPLYLSPQMPTTGQIMVKDENFCLHCGLCAERCPTGAWDMQKFTLFLPKAGDHGSKKN